MDFLTYRKACAVTESKLPSEHKFDMELMVAALQLFALAGSILDQVKKRMFYGPDKKPFDLHKFAKTLSKIEKSISRMDDLYIADGRGYKETHTTSGWVNSRILHGVIGLGTEAAELAEMMIDDINSDNARLPVNNKAHLVEECGDVCWYLSVICDEAELTLEQIFDVNIAKLQGVRYKNGFSPDAAYNRDLDAEKQILEEGTKDAVCCSNDRTGGEG